jgi:hypothetical protein
MPFKSKAQQKFMYAKHPEIAKKWEDKYGIPKSLPQHTKKKNKKVVKALKKAIFKKKR